MNSRTGRLKVLGVVSAIAFVYAPLHYAWRWNQNQRLFEQQHIDKDEWAAGQAVVPAEGWTIGIIGAFGVLIARWKLLDRRSRKHEQVKLHAEQVLGGDLP